MGKERCCCSCPEPYTDDFNRADSDDPGAEWTELVADSDVEASRLRQTPGAICRWNRQPPPSFVVSAVGANIESGNVYRITIDEGGTAGDGAITATWDYTNASSPTVTLAVGGESVTESIQPTEPGGTYPFIICLTRTQVVLGDGHSGLNPIYFCHDLGINSNRRILLANASASNAIRWESITIRQEHSSNSDCPKCVCNCQGKCVPKTLHFSYENLSYCALLDGQSGVLEYDRHNGSRTDLHGSFYGLNPHWDLPDDVRTGCEGFLPPGPFAMGLVCDGNGPAYWRLYLYAGDQGVPSFTPTSYSCDPFMMVFDCEFLDEEDGTALNCCVKQPGSMETWWYRFRVTITE